MNLEQPGRAAPILLSHVQVLPLRDYAKASA